MRGTVHLLAYCRRLELLPATLLVFETLRKGFPDAPVLVRGNGLSAKAEAAVQRAAGRIGAAYVRGQPVTHDGWIEEIVRTGLEPGWVCDTDVVFFEPMRAPEAPWTTLAGRLQPAFEDEYTRSMHVARLEPAVMWLNPPEIRAAMRQWMGQIPAPCGGAEHLFIRQHFVPRRRQWPLFYDTCAGLWQAGIGVAFDDEQNRAFEHLHCGTYADLVSPTLQQMGKGPSLEQVHQAIYALPARARGLWQAQQQFYRARGADRYGRENPHLMEDVRVIGTSEPTGEKDGDGRKARKERNENGLL